MNTCPNCGLVRGMHSSILPGCVCPTTPQDTFTPDWKEEYQKAVELHCITLDELREGMALNRKLEKIVANQDAMLERQTARIVDLQTHIENFDGED